MQDVASCGLRTVDRWLKDSVVALVVRRAFERFYRWRTWGSIAWRLVAAAEVAFGWRAS
jgi:hypothetical protein